MALLAPVRDAAEAAGARCDTISTYPALALAADHPLAERLATLSGQRPLDAVSFGTEAGLFQAVGIPSIVCGPGDISRAHKPEEHLHRDELQAACALIRRLGESLAA